MFEIDYTTVPEFFVQKNNNEVIRYQMEICVKWYLMQVLKDCPNKKELMAEMARKGIYVLINGKRRPVFKSYHWIKKLYYDNLKYNL